MTEAVPSANYLRWRADPSAFMTEVLRDPEDGEPFRLNDAERVFLQHAFELDADGRMKYPELIFAAPKKSGKTAFAAMLVLYTTLIMGGRYSEALVVANDLEQAQGRVFAAIRRIVELCPWLSKSASITQSRISFPEIGASITALAADYASAAGANPNIVAFDELWAYTSERSRRLWDELVPPPTRKIACRLTTTYAGFSGESVLLEELHKRGLAQPSVGPDLHAGNGILTFWTHKPVAPWQTPAWIEQMRGQLRPNAFLRMIENRFVTSESNFVDIEWWDACTDEDARPAIADKNVPCWIGVDASVKRDSTAVVAVAWDAGKVRLIGHRIFQPSASQPLDFEATIEKTVRDWCSRFQVRGVHYDPFQMAAVAQRLSAAGCPMREFPQSVPNLTQAGTTLFELIKGRGIIAYPDADLRLAMSRAVAVETSRGWRIAKEKQSHKIDVIVALAMAACACVEAQGASSADAWISYQRDLAIAANEPDEEPAKPAALPWHQDKPAKPKAGTIAQAAKSDAEAMIEEYNRITKGLTKQSPLNELCWCGQPFQKYEPISTDGFRRWHPRCGEPPPPKKAAA
jgi:hypothetical protein